MPQRSANSTRSAGLIQRGRSRNEIAERKRRAFRCARPASTTTSTARCSAAGAALQEQRHDEHGAHHAHAGADAHPREPLVYLHNFIVEPTSDNRILAQLVTQFIDQLGIASAASP